MIKLISYNPSSVPSTLSMAITGIQGIAAKSFSLDLLAFSDNNNGNIYQSSSTKKCILPDTSFRIMKKGLAKIL